MRFNRTITRWSLLCATFISTFIAQSTFAATRPVTLEDVTEQVTQANYYVLENAQRVYQAKQSIQLARRNLLPRINLFRVVEGVSSPTSLLGLVQDIVPFLVPSNWFHAKEEKILAEATAYGYRALWANELLTARALLLQAGLDERLFDQLNENTKDLDGLATMVRARETMGSSRAGSTKEFEVRKLTLSEEVSTLRKVIQENRSQLAFMLGFPGNDEAVPSGIQYLEPTDRRPLHYEDYETRLLETSYELKQYESLIDAAKVVKKSRYFNFLGNSSISRGGAGSIFDSLPYQDGLGFGLGPSVRIVKSERHILEIQKAAIQESLRKTLKLLITAYNLDLEMRGDIAKRVELTQALWKNLKDRMRLGSKVEVFEFVEASRNRIEALSSYHTVETRLLLNADRLNRLMYWDAYRVVEGPLP